MLAVDVLQHEQSHPTTLPRHGATSDPPGNVLATGGSQSDDVTAPRRTGRMPRTGSTL